MTFAQYKQFLIDGVDPDELVDILNLTTEDLIEGFQEKVYKHWQEEYGEDPRYGDEEDEETEESGQGESDCPDGDY